MHTINARAMTAEDVTDGQEVLAQHGAGYVTGHVFNVTTKERTHDGHVGTEIRYAVKSETGFEYQGTFSPDFLPEAARASQMPLRTLVPDETGDILAVVADNIGSSTALEVFVADMAPAEAEALIVGLLKDAGLDVWKARTGVVSEQRVDILTFDDEIVAADILEAQGHIAARGAHRVNYRPFNSTFVAALSQE